MQNKIVMVCLFALIGSSNAYSETGYEQTYVEKQQSLEGVPVPTKVTKPWLPGASEGLQIDVLLTVDSEGKVAKAEVLESSDSRHNAAVVNAAKRWKFQPRIKNGEAVRSRVKVPFALKAKTEGLAMK